MRNGHSLDRQRNFHKLWDDEMIVGQPSASVDFPEKQNFSTKNRPFKQSM